MFLLLCLSGSPLAVVFLEEELYSSAISRLVKLIVSEHRLTHLAELVARPLVWFWLRPANSLPSNTWAQSSLDIRMGQGPFPIGN